MSRLDALPADQKAVLQLLLKQGKSYDELAGLLKLDPAAVRERALDALDALGPESAAGLTPARQDEVADYLLGQQSASQRADTRTFLEGSAAGRTWARGVAAELRPVAADNLPEVPAEGAEVEQAFDALEARTAARERQERSSKLGGVLLLAGLGIAVAVLLIVLIGGGDDNGSDNASSGDNATLSQTASTDTGSAQQAVENQINLTSTSSNAKAVTYVLKQGGERVLAIAGQSFPATKSRFFYAVWLYSSPSKASRLGFVQSVGSDGKLLTGADPAQIRTKADADRLRNQLKSLYSYKEIVISRETDPKVTKPTTIVASGEITRPPAGGTGATTGSG
jgi:hypothetical protein